MSTGAGVERVTAAQIIASTQPANIRRKSSAGSLNLNENSTGTMFHMPKYSSFKEGHLRRMEMQRFKEQAAMTMGDFYTKDLGCDPESGRIDPNTLIAGGHWM